jgi:hypothetical protein
MAKLPISTKTAEAHSQRILEAMTSDRSLHNKLATSANNKNVLQRRS